MGSGKLQPQIETPSSTMLLHLLCLIPLVFSSPLEILSYSADEEGHSHRMEGVPGEAVTGEFQFQAPDTDTVYHLTYSADSQGFQPVGDHLPVSVEPLVIPEMQLPAMVSYTDEVAEARANFLNVQEELLAQQALDEAENSVEVIERRRRDADPVIIPTSGFPTYPVSYGYQPIYRNYPGNYFPYPSYPVVRAQTPVRQHIYLSYPHSTRVITQDENPVSPIEQEGEDEPAALS